MIKHHGEKTYEEYDPEILVDDYYNFKNQNMKNGIFQIDSSNIKSALVYGVLWGLLAVLVNIQDAGSMFNLNLRDLIDTGVFAFLASFISLLKNFLTNNSGKFLGVVTVIPDKE